MLSCPICKQKLRLQPTMLVGAQLVCPKCDSHLQVASRDPDRIDVVQPAERLTKNAYPESYD